MSLPRDARTVLGGVLALLVLLLVVVSATSGEARLRRFLRRLPAGTEAVLLLGRETERTDRLLWRLVAGAEPPAASGIAAILLVSVPGSATPRTVVLTAGGGAERAGQTSVSLAGLRAWGDEQTIAVLAAGTTRERVPPAAREHLVRVGDATTRLLLTPAGVTRIFTRTGLPPPVEPRTLALAVTGTESALAFEGVLTGDWGDLDRDATPLLSRVEESVAFALDGLPLRTFLPRSLPPILAALEADTGAAAELQVLRLALADQPVALLLRVTSGGLPEVVFAAAVPASERAAVEDAVRTLLARRLALAAVQTERLRVDGRVIRHRRPAPADRPASAGTGTPQAFERDGWRILRAAQGAGAFDLVAALRPGVLLLGASEDAVLRLGMSVTGRPPPADVTATLSGSGLKRLPLVAAGLRGAPAALRPWFETVEQVTLTVDAEADVLRFEGSAQFVPAVPSL